MGGEKGGGRLERRGGKVRGKRRREVERRGVKRIHKRGRGRRKVRIGEKNSKRRWRKRSQEEK